MSYLMIVGYREDGSARNCGQPDTFAEAKEEAQEIYDTDPRFEHVSIISEYSGVTLWRDGLSWDEEEE